MSNVDNKLVYLKSLLEFVEKMRSTLPKEIRWGHDDIEFNRKIYPLDDRLTDHWNACFNLTGDIKFVKNLINRKPFEIEILSNNPNILNQMTSFYLWLIVELGWDENDGYFFIKNERENLHEE